MAANKRIDQFDTDESPDGDEYLLIQDPSTLAYSKATIDDVIAAGGGGGGGGAVDSVNGQTGTVVLDPDDLDDTSTTNKFTTASDVSKLAGIEANADVTDATNVAAAGAFMKAVDDLDDITEGSTNKHFTSTSKSKLDGIEAGADVTDATNVDAAGAVMNSDTSTASMSFVVDEDNMASNSATKVPTQQSTKAYVDAGLSGKASSSHTHTANDVTDFDTEVSNNTDVAANTSARHTRSHTMTSTSDHTAGNHKLFYSNGSGQVVELAHGDSGKVLTSNGTTSAPSWETPTGEGGGGGGSMDDFTLAGDSGTPQTIADGNTLTVAGGTGIDTTAGDTDTVTVALDSASQASLALADTAVQDLSDLGVTASASELNILDGATLTTTELNYVDGVTSALQTQLDGKQASDGDLTAIAALSPSNDDIIQRKAGAWTNRTMSQLKTDLSLSKSDVGLGNVDNTSDASKPISTAAQAAFDGLFINVKHYGVTGDGTTDDSTAINAILNGGHKRVYFPAGTYSCESYLRIYEYTEIVLHPDAVIENDRSDGACLMLNGEAGNDSYATGYDGDGHIIIRGGTIDCSKRTAAESSSQAIAFAHAENIRIENVRFYNNKQDHFVEINSSKNVRIRDCTFDTTVLTSPDTREAINIDYAGSSSFPHFGDDDGTVCEDVLIEGCTFIDCDSAVGTHGEPASSGRHKKIRVVNCYIKDCVTRAIDGRYWNDSVISGNTIDSDAGCQIRYTSSSESVIANNTLIGTSGSGIAGSSAAGIVISGNVVSTAGNSIYAGGSRITVVGNSVISSNASVEAIMIDAVTNGNVSGNKSQVTASSGYGVRVRASTNVQVCNNLILNCNTAGILVGANGDSTNSENCLVAMNRITSSGSPTNSILLGTKSVKTMRFGNMYTNGGSISDSGSGTITSASDSS